MAGEEDWLLPHIFDDDDQLQQCEGSAFFGLSHTQYESGVLDTSKDPSILF